MDISKHLEAIAQLLGAQFELYGKSIEAGKVFSPKGLLPAFSKRADSNSLFTLNKPLGAQFKKNSQAVAGIEVTFDTSVPGSYRILCITDVLIELMQNNAGQERIKLDQLLYD